MITAKERLLNTASTLFHKQGYNSTGINQIIKEASIAKATFYTHFKSKDELCLAYLTNRHLYWFNELKTFVHSQQASNTKEEIIATFDFLIYMNKKEAFRGCSFLNILSEISSEQKRILLQIQNHKQDLRAYFQQIIHNEITASHIYLLFESAIIESQLFKSNELIDKAKQIINNTL